MTDIIRHRMQLERLKGDLLDQVKPAEGLQKHLPLRESTQELSMVDNHPADLGSENYERGKDISLHEKNLLILTRVEEALQKINMDEYGYCENCGNPIPEDRLDAVPYTEFCIECKKDAEGIKHDFPRPIEEPGLMTPFARTSTRETDFTAYDGEDAWQDVELYNRLPHVEYGDVGEDEEEIGIVEETDRISNEEYREQLPD